MIEPGDPNATDSIDARLRSERPTTDPAYREGLRRRLLALDPGGASRPRHLGTLIAAYAACGSILLAVAVLGVLGSGPLAA
jgi:hypothetical protein